MKAFGLHPLRGRPRPVRDGSTDPPYARVRPSSTARRDSDALEAQLHEYGGFNASTLADANQIIKTIVAKHQDSEPEVAAWIEENIHEGLAVLQLPSSHRRRLRTSNAVERLNKEIKRRTRVAGLFPNEAALLRLVTALAIEVSEDWEADRQYLTMEQA